MRIICPGWFGNDHGPVVVAEYSDGGPASHGMCSECQRLANTILEEGAVRDWTGIEIRPTDAEE